MKVKEIMVGGSVVEFYDDCIVNEEEKQRLLERASRIILAGLSRIAKQNEETA